jgi:hypothetical protein
MKTKEIEKNMNERYLNNPLSEWRQYDWVDKIDKVYVKNFYHSSRYAVMVTWSDYMKKWTAFFDTELNIPSISERELDMIKLKSCLALKEAGLKLSYKDLVP